MGGCNELENEKKQTPVEIPQGFVFFKELEIRKKKRDRIHHTTNNLIVRMFYRDRIRQNNQKNKHKPDFLGFCMNHN
jgi:hypothetical protein